MVVLNKIKASTLVEVLIASVLILVIFMISSMTILNGLSNYDGPNMRNITNKIKEISYLRKNKKLSKNSQIKYHSWIINVDEVKSGNIIYLKFNCLDTLNGHNYNKEIKIYE